MESTNIYVDCIVNNLPVSPTFMDTLKAQLEADSVCSRVMKMCADGWPEHAKQEPLQKNVWPEQATQDGLLLKDTRLVIPATMRNDVLNRLGQQITEMLLMVRRLRTTVPTHPSELQPELPDRSLLFQKERVKRMTDAANFNRRHRAKPLGSLSSGQNVWITDTQTSGTVIQSHTSPRSYLVDAPHGVVRRNRMHLIPLQSPAQDEGGQQQQEPLPVLEQDHAPPAVGSPVHSPGVSIPRTTRSGRVIKQPTRLNL
ncbi:unnamed protein product [Menidia menidia]|uniref:(Atlantic silverside) hypothetical protein n=1 Tax=Menidia menidia TaxID=238744 RepID=A0A8S4B7X4_9TELE|nr:unnamed protein product [Menidia menidia]